MPKKKPETVLKYKGTPMVWRDDTLIYGNIMDSHYIQMSILDRHTVGDLEVAGNIRVELMNGTRVVKKAEREGMYNAMDIAEFWLADALEG